MKQRYFLLFVLLLKINGLNAQTSYFDGKFKVTNFTTSGFHYTLYDFSRESNVVKAKYFATNAYKQYLAWKANKQILLVTAGAFSDAYNSDAKPVGICVDNGIIVNKTIRDDWDALVIIYNGSAQQGGVAVVDLSQKPVTVKTTFPDGPSVTYGIRNSLVDRLNFLKWGESQGVTLFQTQLVYSADKASNSLNPNYGDKRERRFLSICKKDGVVHHIVVDGPDYLPLNLSTTYAKTVLEYYGMNVLYIMNLDVGDKNVLHVFNGTELKNLNPFNGTAEHADRSLIRNATNLLIYYKD